MNKEEKILQQIAEGKSQHEIAQLEGVAQQTISYWISKMDKEKVEEAREKAEAARIKAREAATKKETQETTVKASTKKSNQKNERTIDAQNKASKYRKLIDRKTTIKIAQVKIMIDLYITANQTTEAISFINSLINNKDIEIIDRNKLQELKEQVKAIENKIAVKSLLENSPYLSISEIADKIGIREIEAIRIKKQLETQSQEQEEKTEQITDKEIKQKLNDHTITQQDIINYRQQLDDKHDSITMEEIVFMINIYIKVMQSSKAISFIDSIINNEEMKKFDKKKLQKIKEQVIAIKKRQEIRRLLGQNIATNVISGKLKVEEAEVIRIKEEMEQKRNKQQFKTLPQYDGR